MKNFSFGQATMSSEEFREFINQRLTAAATEIFEAFEKTINNYRDEVDRYKDMLEIVCKPHVKMHQIELLKQPIDPEPHRPESSDNGENICKNQDGAEVLLEKQDIKKSQDILPIKSEPDQEQEFQSQSSPVVLWGKDQDGREGPMVKMGEDRALLQRQIVLTRQIKIQLQRTELQPLPVTNGEHLSESTRTEEDNQEVGIIQEREKSASKQEDHHLPTTRSKQKRDVMVAKDSDEPFLSAAAEDQGQTQSLDGSTDDNSTIPTESGSNSDPNSQPGEKPFICDTCGISFSKYRSFILHMKVHTDGKPYCCKTCGKCFRSSLQLADHINIHTGNKPYSCNICNKSFRRKSNLNRHRKSHSGETFSCEICKKCFVWKKDLIYHMNIHLGGKIYPCEKCPRIFLWNCRLKSHAKTHTQKTFVCEICGENFYQKGDLQRHSKVHLGEKPHCCEVCGKGFIEKTQLNIHMRHHTGGRFSCETCGKNFLSKYCLKMHMKVHTSEIPHRCQICNKSFIRKTVLNAHMKLHTDGKYCCETCSKIFMSKHQLKMHMKVHAQDEKL